MTDLTVIPNTYKTTYDIDNAIDRLTYNIHTAIHESTMYIHRRPSSSASTPQTVLRMISWKNILRKRWQRLRTPDLKREVNNLSRRIRLELDQHRVDRYRTYLTDICPGDPSLWWETRRLLGQETTNIPPLTNGLTTVTSDEDKADLLADHLENTFQPLQRTDDATDSLVDSSLLSTRLTDQQISFVSPREVSLLIKKLPNRKAPGEDLIPNIVLKKLPRKCHAFLTSIFNECLRRGYFPTAWKNAIVIFFHKPGKPKQEPRSYRPISLLNTMSKLLEKIIEQRLRHHLEEKIPLYQFGFKPRHSAVQQIQRVVELIANGFEAKKYTTSLFLDVTKAFDSVWHGGLLHKLRGTQSSTYLYSMVQSRPYISSKNKLSPNEQAEYPCRSPAGSNFKPSPLPAILPGYA